MQVPDGVPPNGQLVDATHLVPCWVVPVMQVHCWLTQAENGAVQS